jgi:hypothetical protein
MAVAEVDTALASVATWANGDDSGNGGADNNQQNCGGFRRTGLPAMA